jgi:hypothetical protein
MSDLAATTTNPCFNSHKPLNINRKEQCKMKHQIINYMRAGYPGLYRVSPEEQRVEAEIKHTAQELKYNLVFWSAVDGLVDTSKSSTSAANDPLEALIAIKDMEDQTIILLREFHLFLQDPNPILIRQLKDVLQEAKTKWKTLIIWVADCACLPNLNMN